MKQAKKPHRPETETAPKEDIVFTPVPAKRKRASGWTPKRQRGFIRQLGRIGVVAAAARSVGMSPKSAYGLRKRAQMQRYLSGEPPPDWDADKLDFIQAWEIALETGRDNACAAAIDRALYGETVIIRLSDTKVAERRVYNNRLLSRAIARPHGAARR